VKSKCGKRYRRESKTGDRVEGDLSSFVAKPEPYVPKTVQIHRITRISIWMNPEMTEMGRSHGKGTSFLGATT
jgi:hypothetical protein